MVLDASVLIAHLDESDAHHGAAARVLFDAADEDLAASWLTVAEVLVGPARSGHLDRASAALAQLGVATLRVDVGHPTELARLRASSGLKMPDCCVVLAAEHAGAGVATFDVRLAAESRRRGLRVVDGAPMR